MVIVSADFWRLNGASGEAIFRFTEEIMKINVALVITMVVAGPAWSGGHEKGEYQREHPEPQKCNGLYDMSLHQNLVKTLPATACPIQAPPGTYANGKRSPHFQCDNVGNPVKIHGMVPMDQPMCVVYSANGKKFSLIYTGGSKMGHSEIRSDQKVWAVGEGTAVTWMSSGAAQNYASNEGDPNSFVPPQEHGKNTGSPSPIEAPPAPAKGTDQIDRAKKGLSDVLRGLGK